ncbi:benzoate/H(+) symporter BenE family transporter [Dermacoccaceae bacterium W4C1]
MSSSPARVGLGPAVVAGIVTGVVGFASSFAVVLQGLSHVGATREQAASGLLILSVTMGLGSILFSWCTREPVTMAWSTPGAALLLTTAAPAGGFATAVTAFALTGLLIIASGLLRPLERLVEAIPTSIANAMLAGVLLTLCLEPVRALVAEPAQLAPVVAVWVVLMKFARTWAVLGAVATAVVVMAFDGAFGRVSAADLAPGVEFVAPGWGHLVPAVAIAVPLWLVTMTSQNIPGLAVLRSFGYRPRLRPMMTYTGAASAAGALLGGHAINLAAISAALAAGPDAHPDTDRRWVAGMVGGCTAVTLGLASAAVTAIAGVAPAGLLAAIAGLALIGTFASSASAALSEPSQRDAAALTFIVCASGISVAGVGAAFWGLLVGIAWLIVMRRRSAM